MIGTEGQTVAWRDGSRTRLPTGAEPPISGGMASVLSDIALTPAAAARQQQAQLEAEAQARQWSHDAELRQREEELQRQKDEAAAAAAAAARAKEMDDYRSSQEQTLAQLRASQEEAVRAKETDAQTQLAQLTAAADAAEQRRLAALRQAVSKTRAGLGARGVTAQDGSGEAILLGLTNSSETERKDAQATDQMKRAAIQQSLDEAKRRNEIVAGRVDAIYEMDGFLRSISAGARWARHWWRWRCVAAPPPHRLRPAQGRRVGRSD